MKYLFVVLGVLLFEESAHAYLDPGTGSIIIQSAIAAIAGAAITLKVYWISIRNFLAQRKNGKSKTDENGNSETDKNGKSELGES